MRKVNFKNWLDDANILRVSFEVERGNVKRFVVQLESCLNQTWHPVVRYDTAHGFVHRDLLHPHQPATKLVLHVKNYREALTFAIKDLTKNWHKHRQRYEAWLKQK